MKSATTTEATRAGVPEAVAPIEEAVSPARPARPLERLFHVVPALDSLRSYSLRALRLDTQAGLTVAAVAVPQAMAYASIAGLPPQYGLYTAIVMTAVGALFDSSRQLINGPTNAISIALLSALAVCPRGDQRLPAAILMALLVGVDPDRHHPAAARRPDPLHLARRHRRLHARRRRPARAGPDEEPARPAGAGQRRRPFLVALLADADRGGGDHGRRRCRRRRRRSRSCLLLRWVERRRLRAPAARAAAGGRRAWRRLVWAFGLDERRGVQIVGDHPARRCRASRCRDVDWDRRAAAGQQRPGHRAAGPARSDRDGQGDRRAAPGRSSTSTSSASARGWPTWPAASSSASPARGR